MFPLYIHKVYHSLETHPSANGDKSKKSLVTFVDLLNSVQPMSDLKNQKANEDDMFTNVFHLGFPSKTDKAEESSYIDDRYLTLMKQLTMSLYKDKALLKRYQKDPNYRYLYLFMYGTDIIQHFNLPQKSIKWDKTTKYFQINI